MKFKKLNKKTLIYLSFFVFVFLLIAKDSVKATCCCYAERPEDRKQICIDVEHCNNGNYNPCFDWAQQKGYKNIVYGKDLVCPDNCKDSAINFQNKNILVPKLSIPIPGLNLTSETKSIRVCAECQETVAPGQNCPDDKCARWTYEIPWIGEYLFAFYRWAVAAIAVFAVLIITYSGFQMITAAGQAEKISHARDSIFAGIIGLVILLIGHQLLSMIDPRLTILKPIIIGEIKREEWELMESDIEEGRVNNDPGNGSGLSVGGSCFPVASSDLNNISWNWGSRRSNGTRCHAGIDLLTKGSGEVLAMADGQIVGNFFFYKCSGGGSNAIMIDHGNFVALYGEINSDTAVLGAGTTVRAGQSLGKATYCDMLHLELYSKGTTTNYRWLPPNGKVVESGANYCRNAYLATKPERLLDPTETIKGLGSKKCK